VASEAAIVGSKNCVSGAQSSLLVAGLVLRGARVLSFLATMRALSGE
jgi:hypothetical protein